MTWTFNSLQNRCSYWVRYITIHGKKHKDSEKFQEINYVLVSYCHYHKYPLIWWLKITNLLSFSMEVFQYEMGYHHGGSTVHSFWRLLGETVSCYFTVSRLHTFLGSWKDCLPFSSLSAPIWWYWARLDNLG